MAVVVLSGSDETKDHQRARALGARSYLVKPPQPADLGLIMESLTHSVDLPNEGKPLTPEAGR
jgi:CheY-like chemotaxis protein